jgi:AcrR family transcriptional regulator
MKAKNAPTIDRRIQKTRKLLIESLISLTIEKGYENVTIQDIIDKANVGRSTFYLHFENKDQLLVGNDNFQELLSRSIKASSGSEINFLHIYEHVAENHGLAKIFLGKKGSPIVREHFHNIFRHIIKEHYKHKIDSLKTDKRMFSFLLDAASYATCSLLLNWATNDMPFSTSEMADKSRDIVNAIFRKSPL